MVVNKRIIARFSQYRKALLRFQELGMVKVFSDTLADAVGVTSAQVRKDFSLYGITGNKRGGYQIEELLVSLHGILGKDRVQEVVVVGCGNIGRALIRYEGFKSEGIQIVAGFDTDPKKHGELEGIPILPMEAMRPLIQNRRIQVAIIAVPESSAQAVCDQLVDAGIKGILNFAPIRLKAPDDVVINPVLLQTELESVIYFVNALKKSKRSPRLEDKKRQEEKILG